jgi:resuscitation-promoting factor RpfB
VTIARWRAPQRPLPGQTGALLVVVLASVALLVTCAPLPAEGDREPTTSERPIAALASNPPATSPADPSPSAARQPEIEVRTVTETRRIPFKTRTVKDPALAEDTTKVRTKGVDGVKTLTHEVTFANGVQTGRKLVRETVTKAPVTQVTAVGTKTERACDPNHSGACVPIASDVDCAGGSGNGPAYVSGMVKVVGSDIYDLDRDGDGYGCG